jgi:hypothetical protein
VARRYLSARRRRSELAPTRLFADPAWDILLDLFAASAEGRRVSVSSACIASGVANSTALRWVGELVREGLVARRRDGRDARRTFLEIDPAVADEVERWLGDVF